MSPRLNERSSSSKPTLLRLFSKSEYYDLIVTIGDQVSNHNTNMTSDFLRNKFNLTKKECNSRIGILMNCDLIDMFNNQYMLTTLGKDVYESLRMMENAIKLREKFDTSNKSILDDISFIY